MHRLYLALTPGRRVSSTLLEVAPLEVEASIEGGDGVMKGRFTGRSSVDAGYGVVREGKVQSGGARIRTHEVQIILVDCRPSEP